MTAQIVPVQQRSPEWLAERRRHLGSSDAPVVAGERGSWLSLWAEKALGVDPEFTDADRELMTIGELLEPSLRELYTYETGRPIRARHVMHVSRQWPVAAASLDAESGRRLVETKWSHSAEWFQAVADGSPDPVPGAVMAQCQWQLYVTGRDVVDVAILLGRDFKVIEVGRDDAFIDNLLFMARRLWSFVERGERPPVDGSEATRKTLTRLHPRDDGSLLPADQELTNLVALLRTQKLATKQAQADEDTTANALRALIGDASGITGLVSWKKNADSHSVDWKAVAEAYRLLLLAPPQDRLVDADELEALRSLHTTTKEGPRVLRLLGAAK